MRPQLLSFIKDPKLVGRSRWYHLNVVDQLFNLLPTHISVVFETRVSDIERKVESTQLCDAFRMSAWRIIVFALIDVKEKSVLEISLAAEKSVP